jgi:excinuclease UvrABC nuclease subunit
MYDSSGTLLYVGKAKSLRARLRSYRYYALSKKRRAQRKLKNLLNQVDRIEIQELASELQAFLHENKVLREKKPPFNVLNKNPELYRYFVLRSSRSSMIFEVTTEKFLQGRAEDLVFGAFKGRGDCREFFDSIAQVLKLILKLTHRDAKDWGFQKTSRRISLSFAANQSFSDWIDLFKNFLRGQNKEFLKKCELLFEVQFKKNSFDQFEIKKELKLISRFYEKHLRAQFKMLEKMNLALDTIPSEELDDWLSLYRSEYQGKRLSHSDRRTKKRSDSLSKSKTLSRNRSIKS